MVLWVSGNAMLSFLISVILFWTMWVFFEVDYLLVTMDPAGEGLSTVIYAMTAVFHIYWLGKWVAK